MDIHRCRFVPYSSSAINALSFSHPTSSGARIAPPPTLRLAIGRANGDIEIWNPLKGEWFQESILRGGKDRSIEALAWTEDPEDVDKNGHKIPGKLRLFSTGYSDVVTEWDLAAGRPLRHASANHGDIWCMAAQPKASLPPKLDPMDEDERKGLESQAQTQSIAVGCADGSIVLISTTDHDLQFHKVVARPGKKKTRVLALTWQNRHTVIAGHADSTIRIYDIRGGQQIRNMTLGAGPRGGPKEILVWSVKCLKNGTIVSGDSNGVVSFWDGKQYALLQRIQGHDADVLDIAVSADDRTVFSGGIDRRTTLYQKASPRYAGDIGRWAKASHVRIHRNDVKAMAAYEATRFSILVSGGLDTHPVVVPIQQFNKEHHRMLSSLPQQYPVDSAPKHRLMVSSWDREVKIWSVTKPSGQVDLPHSEDDLQESAGGKLLTKILIQGDEHITSATLAPNGQLLAVATISEVRMFWLLVENAAMKVRRHPMPIDVGKIGARFVQFSPDGHWLFYITPENCMNLLRLVELDDQKQRPCILPKVVSLRRLHRDPINQSSRHGSLGRYDRSVTRASFSSDSKILAVSDISGFIDTWLLEGHEDLTQEETPSKDEDDESSSDSDTESDSESKPTLILGQQWIRNPTASLIPKLNKAPLILSFRSSLIDPAHPMTNGAPGLHPTRHTPHPHSHDLPTGEDRLLIITSDNSIREFNVLTGRLSDWSRRNPQSLFPQNYRDLRDPAKGVVWDISSANERVWVWGVSWLWMFDLSKDFAQPNASSNSGTMVHVNGDTPLNGQVKRKRDDRSEDEHSRIEKRMRNPGTGAGSKRHENELNTGIGSIVRKIEGADAGRKFISFDSYDSNPPSGNEDDGNEGVSTALLSFRRGDPAETEGDADVNAEAMDFDPSDPSAGEETALVKRKTGKLLHWHTFKYRPILGIVPIRGASDGDGAGEGGVEVAVVERPLWDIEMPGRYVGEQEWGA